MDTTLMVIAVVALLIAAGAAAVMVWWSFAARRSTDDLRSGVGVLRDRSERLESIFREELSRSREEASLSSRQIREEVGGSLKGSADSQLSRMAEIATLQKNQLDAFAKQLSVLTQTNELKLERLRETVEGRLRQLQEDNSTRLEQMRSTVDEKLHSTLERRLSESFQLVSRQLEGVQKGLGEMQSLASGVGDLKKVLTNIKTRGTWGEIQLGNLLEEILTPDQYGRNIATKPGSSERVEFAVRLPGRDGDDTGPLWLPIDAKFPQEDYQRLMDAQEQANTSLVDEAGKALEQRIRLEAKAIREKYVDPPHTTDFGIMFLPTEGLYAEVLRRPGLFDALQREYRVVVTGPTTLLAVLNSLQMGFRTLAIEKRSSEVWLLLGAVKTEFGKFGDLLDKTQKKLQEASNSIESAAMRSRVIEKKLRKVQQLPAADANALLGPAEESPEDTDAAEEEQA